MKNHPSVLSKTFFVFAIGLLFFLAPGGMTQATHAYPPLVTSALIDEFDGTKLNPAQWTVVSGKPIVRNGRLILDGDNIQSRQKFKYGLLQMVITSTSWKAQTETTDSTFGFELWGGKNGKCHYGVILVANGHLGLLKSQPDAEGKCSGDPALQEYLPISDWDTVRAAGTVRVTLTWALRSVTLHVTSGETNQGIAYYFGSAEPVNMLKIRLNAVKGETFRIGYVHFVPVPWN